MNAVGRVRQAKRTALHRTIYIHIHIHTNANDSTNGKLKSCSGLESNASKLLIYVHVFFVLIFLCCVPFTILFFITHTFVRSFVRSPASQPASLSQLFFTVAASMFLSLSPSFLICVVYVLYELLLHLNWRSP